MNCEVILIRHAEVDQRWKGICYGALDVALSPKGDSDSWALAERLAAVQVQKPRLGLVEQTTRIFHSGLSRTEILAQRIAQQLSSSQLVHDERLRERNYGLWQGLTWDEVYASDPEHFHEIIDRPDTYRPPGGETTSEMQRRVARWFEEITTDARNSRIIAISHSGPIAALAGHLLGLPANQWQPWTIQNLEAIHVTLSNSGSVGISKLDLQADRSR